jgi:hypothetical protein
VRELEAPSEPDAPPAAAPVAADAPPSTGADFRARFPATLRTQDGHFVRSRAEVMIGNAIERTSETVSTYRELGA